MTTKKTSINVQGIAVSVLPERDFICLTDSARAKSSDRTDDLVRNWLRNCSPISKA